jgi:hypothetical protein
MLRVKLLYGKDFRALLLKYGRIDVAASMVGVEGQALAEASIAALDGSAGASRPSPGIPSAVAVGRTARARTGAVPGQR